MAITLSHLKNQRKQTEFDYFAEHCEITYNPGAFDDHVMEQIRTAVKEENDSFVNDMLATLALEWNVVDDQGIMIPLRDGGAPAVELRDIPIFFKQAALTAIMEDVQGNPQRSAGRSADTSQRKGK